LQHSNAARALRPRAGRPTREEAGQRRAEVLDIALEVFLERGYEGATVDQIAAAAGASKRTLYAHYEDKPALFKAAVARAIERYADEAAKVMVIQSDDLEEALTALGRMRLAHVMSPVGQRLQRILHSEAYRFPEIFAWSYEKTAKPMLDFLADVLRRHAADGRLDIDDPDRTAAAFLSLVVGGPARAVASGQVLDPVELEDRVRFCVQLFLRGVLTR
jgi:TetR/AcrR family transcriptional regulator, mexJK operon transcriptional repressor